VEPYRLFSSSSIIVSFLHQNHLADTFLHLSSKLFSTTFHLSAHVRSSLSKHRCSHLACSPVHPFLSTTRRSFPPDHKFFIAQFSFPCFYCSLHPVVSLSCYLCCLCL
jgi:hypothetical protein